MGLRGLFTSGAGSLLHHISFSPRPLSLVNQMDLLPVAFWMRLCRLQAFSIAHPWLCVLSFLLARTSGLLGTAEKYVLPGV